MLSVCWFWGHDDKQDPILNLQEARSPVGSQDSKYMGLMNLRDCLVGFTDNSLGNWEETLIVDERRRVSGMIRVTFELRQGG